MLGYIKFKLEQNKTRRKWAQMNTHNSTHMLCMFDLDRVHVGRYTYGGLYVLNHGEKQQLTIGDFCSIGENVTFVVCADHPVNHISTFPFKVKCLKTESREATSKGDIILEDDVWIGQNAMILSGVTIGQGAIVAANSTVTKDVPPYAIVGGNPAKVIKYRFSDEIIEELLKVDFKKLTEKQIEENIGTLYEELTEGSQLSWMPRK